MDKSVGSGFVSRFELNGFVFQELFKTIFAVFAAIAGLFIATEWRIAIERRAVDIYLAGAHATRKCQRVIVAAAPNAAA